MFSATNPFGNFKRIFKVPFELVTETSFAWDPEISIFELVDFCSSTVKPLYTFTVLKSPNFVVIGSCANTIAENNIKNKVNFFIRKSFLLITNIGNKNCLFVVNYLLIFSNNVKSKCLRSKSVCFTLIKTWSPSW